MGGFCWPNFLELGDIIQLDCERFNANLTSQVSKQKKNMTNRTNLMKIRKFTYDLIYLRTFAKQYFDHYFVFFYNEI